MSLTIRIYLHSFSHCCGIMRNSHKIRTYGIKVIQGHRSWCQSKAHMQLPISH